MIDVNGSVFLDPLSKINQKRLKKDFINFVLRLFDDCEQVAFVIQ